MLRWEIANVLRKKGIWVAHDGDYAEAQIAATLERLDGAWLRRLELEGLSR